MSVKTYYKDVVSEVQQDDNIGIMYKKTKLFEGDWLKKQYKNARLFDDFVTDTVIHGVAYALQRYKSKFGQK